MNVYHSLYDVLIILNDKNQSIFSRDKMQRIRKLTKCQKFLTSFIYPFTNIFFPSCPLPKNALSKLNYFFTSDFFSTIKVRIFTTTKNIPQQAEAEVVPSSSSVHFKIESDLVCRFNFYVLI